MRCGLCCVVSLVLLSVGHVSASPIVPGETLFQLSVESVDTPKSMEADIYTPVSHHDMNATPKLNAATVVAPETACIGEGCQNANQEHSLVAHCDDGKCNENQKLTHTESTQSANLASAPMPECIGDSCGTLKANPCEGESCSKMVAAISPCVGDKCEKAMGSTVSLLEFDDSTAGGMLQQSGPADAMIDMPNVGSSIMPEVVQNGADANAMEPPSPASAVNLLPTKNHKKMATKGSQKDKDIRATLTTANNKVVMDEGENESRIVSTRDFNMNIQSAAMTRQMNFNLNDKVPAHSMNDGMNGPLGTVTVIEEKPHVDEMQLLFAKTSSTRGAEPFEMIDEQQGGEENDTVPSAGTSNMIMPEASDNADLAADMEKNVKITQVPDLSAL